MPRATSAAAGLRDSLRLFWSAADRAVRGRIAAALTLIVTAGVLLGLAPICLKLAVEALGPQADAKALTGPALFIGAYVLCHFLARCASELKTFVHGGADRRIQRLVSERLFSHVIRLPMRFHVERRSGAVGQTLAMGLTGYQQIVQQLAYTIIPVFVEIATISLVLLHFGRPVYLALLAGAAVAYAVAFGVYTRGVAAPSRAVASSNVDAHGLLTDYLLNHEAVKSFNAEAIAAERYRAALLRTEDSWRRYQQLLARNGLAVATIFAATLGSSLVLAGREVAAGTMTVGDFVLVNAYVVQLARPLESLGMAARSLVHGTGFLHKLLELFRESPEPALAAGERPARCRAVDVVFEAVSFSYGAGGGTLRHLDFTIPAGRTVAVVGASGSGKSSLVRLLLRLYEPDAGRILLGGRPIAAIPLAELRRLIAVVPQDTVLFNDTIAYNIALGMPDIGAHHVEHAAKVAQLHDFVATLPQGYDTRVGERGMRLSGGERQRIAIARAAIRQPLVFVFDEATSSLDSGTEQEVVRNLVALSANATTLLIAHRLATVAHADEILVLDDGSIVERGRHAELLRMGGRYAAMWRSQPQVIQQSTFA